MKKIHTLIAGLLFCFVCFLYGKALAMNRKKKEERLIVVHEVIDDLDAYPRVVACESFDIDKREELYSGLRQTYRERMVFNDCIEQYQAYCDGVVNKIQEMIEDFPLKHLLSIEYRIFSNEQSEVGKELEGCLLKAYIHTTGADQEMVKCLREKIDEITKWTNRRVDGFLCQNEGSSWLFDKK